MSFWMQSADSFEDDVIILPLGILAAIRLMPTAVLQECQRKAAEREARDLQRPVNKLAAVLIVLTWSIAAIGAWRVWGEGLQQHFSHRIKTNAGERWYTASRC